MKRLVSYFSKVEIALWGLSTIFIVISFIIFALLYALNDVVLIVLWILASISDIRYVSVIICFIAFFFNDIYGFINWKKIKKRQCE